MFACVCVCVCVCVCIYELCNPFRFVLIFFVHLIFPSHKVCSCVCVLFFKFLLEQSCFTMYYFLLYVKTTIPEDTCTPMCIVALFTAVRTWKQPPSAEISGLILELMKSSIWVRDQNPYIKAPHVIWWSLHLWSLRWAWDQENHPACCHCWSTVRETSCCSVAEELSQESLLETKMGLGGTIARPGSGLVHTPSLQENLRFPGEASSW